MTSRTRRPSIGEPLNRGRVYASICREYQKDLDYLNGQIKELRREVERTTRARDETLEAMMERQL